MPVLDSAPFFGGRTASTRDDWQTPLEYIHALGAFDLDPCANLNDPTRCARRGFTEADDGLCQSWSGRVWLNPPYGREAKAWVRKLGEHGNGVALIPPRMGAQWFQDLVLKKADALLFHRGRIGFIDPTTGKPARDNNADSVFVAFGSRNVDAFERSNIPGELFVGQQRVERLAA